MELQWQQENNFPFPHCFKESCIQEKAGLSTTTKKAHTNHANIFCL